MLKNYYIYRILFLVVFLFCLSGSGTAQSITEDKQDNKKQISLEGLTEAVLVNNQPTLRILSRKSGTTEVKIQKRDNEDAFVFEVYKVSYKLPDGKLYVTKDKVFFDPYEKKSAYFTFSKADIKSVKVEKRGFAQIKSEKDTEEIIPHLGETIDDDSGKDYLPVSDFIVRTIENFDLALAEFNKLTASVRQEEESEETETEETEADITDKYDRFKDVTTVTTSKMLVRGNKRSVRTYAEYNFAGKTQKKPEKVSLYFYASAARPLFREDNLELNFLVDDERVSLGEAKISDEEKTKTATKQTIAVTIPYETFEQIANGKKVEFQIGTLEYKLTDVHLETFRKLLAYKVEE